jgi:hypothetical protein
VLSALVLGFCAGCAAPDRQLDLLSFNTSIDQSRIARYYQNEAFRFRRQAENSDARAEMYERMFGPESDWVSGARLLAQSYRFAADDRDRLAQEHLEAWRNSQSPASSIRPKGSLERTP